MRYFEAVDELLSKNKRSLKSRDAQSHYFELITDAQVDEELAYSINYLFDMLGFSAAEMWIGAREWKFRKDLVTQLDVDVIMKLLLHKENKEYYSDELIKDLVNVYKYVKDKYNNKQSNYLEDHLYRSIDKELICYRRGNKLVADLMK